MGLSRVKQHHVFDLQAIQCTATMDEAGLSMATFQGRHLTRVTSALLDPRKNWYIFTKTICGMEKVGEKEIP